MSGTMNKMDREKLVLEQLQAKKRIEISEMSEFLGVSESTVRRLFNGLEQSGKAIRVHGGLSLAAGGGDEYSFKALIHRRRQEKLAIGKLAYSTVRDRDVLYLDGGTTTLAFCLVLVSEDEGGGAPRNIQIFTNSLANLEVLSPRFTVNLIGGIYRPYRKDFAGYSAEIVLRGLHFDKCFLGTDGVTVPNDFTTTDFDTARLNQIVSMNSNATYVLCDSSKFGRKSLIAYADASKVHAILTDTGVSPQVAEAFSARGVQVVTG